MARNYISTLFTDDMRELQQADGSRASYARMEGAADGTRDSLGEKELGFIAARDSFYLASVTSAGWPYVQHRGGPPGFLRRIGGNRLGFADRPGNRQFVSTANHMSDPRVSLFLMDYPNRRRLKLLGHARIVWREDDEALVDALSPNGEANLPRATIIDVIGFDWNCPQYITPRWTAAELVDRLAPLEQQLTALREENARLRAATGGILS